MFAFGDYNTSDLLWLGDWSPAWIALLTALGVAVLAFSAYDLRDLKGYRRLALIGLRGLVFSLALLLLLEPALDLREVSKIENHVVVLVDESQTMDLKTGDGEATRMDRVQEALQEFAGLEDTGSGDHFFDYYTYGADLESTSREAIDALSPTARSADLSTALEEVNERYQGRDIAAVVILSDGIDTGAMGRRTARGESLDQASLDLLESIDAPVHTLAAAGAEGLRDAAVSRVLHDDFAFVHNKVSVDVEIQAIGMDREPIPVTLRRNGQTVDTQTVQVHPEESSYDVTFEFVPDQIGKEVYTVDIPEFEGEALYENNRQHFVLRVIRDRIRVLQVVGRPSWDQRFLRRLLKRNPNVELISFFILRTDGNPQIVPQDEMSLIPFPTDELFNDELGSFDLVIFQNFNFGPYQMGRYLQNIADFVRDGGAFAMVGGDLSFASGGYGRTPIESLLPVELPPSDRLSTVTDDEHFNPELTAAGDRHPLTQLAFDPERNRELWASLPPLQGSNIVTKATDDATVLATHPTLEGSDGPMPVISVAERGEGRVMAVTSDSTWRWGFENIGQGGTAREYQHFWNSAIRWLIQDPELKLVRLDMHRDIIAPQTAMDATVRVFEPDYSPAEGTEGNLVIERTPLEALRGEGSPEPGHFDTTSFRTDNSGRWELDRPFDQPGVYHLAAEVESPAGTSTDENLLLVTPDIAQYRDIVPRNDFLARIADATDGYHTVLPDFRAQQLTFSAPRHVEVHRREVVQLWDNFYLFLIILGLLGAEWSLRRRWGRL